MTSKDSPSAASQAANTSSTIGIMLANVMWLFRMVTDIITNRDSIMPSRHSKDDIRWDR